MPHATFWKIYLEIQRNENRFSDSEVVIINSCGCVNVTQCQVSADTNIRECLPPVHPASRRLLLPKRPDTSQRVVAAVLPWQPSQVVSPINIDEPKDAEITLKLVLKLIHGHRLSFFLFPAHQGMKADFTICN